MDAPKHSFPPVVDAGTRVRRLPIGGTAIGTGINADPRFGRRMAKALAALSGTVAQVRSTAVQVGLRYHALHHLMPSMPYHSLPEAHRRLVRDTEAGLIPPQADSRPALHSNTRPDGARTVRTLVRRRDQLSGPTVTIAVLAAVSTAWAVLARRGGEWLIRSMERNAEAKRARRNGSCR